MISCGIYIKKPSIICGSFLNQGLWKLWAIVLGIEISHDLRSTRYKVLQYSMYALMQEIYEA